MPSTVLDAEDTTGKAKKIKVLPSLGAYIC